jgi:hypothetical protein
VTARIEGGLLIARPVEEVFDVVADERNEPRYNPHMRRATKLTPGPVGVGTRFLAEMESRPAIAMTTELTAYERPRVLGSTTEVPGAEIRGTISFEPVPEGTRMQWRWAVEPRGLLRLATPLIARLGGRQERRIWTGLKRMLEA